ncbi:MAG: hypothetical protein Q8O13_03575 [Candidatus Omnitrophota bacterium]|nr:hypothetical protein [Candidatus Omnitrophota bacterium]
MKSAPLSLFLLLLIGCASTQSLSSLQRRAIEAKELEGSFNDAFKATLQVLQDKGYVITHTDYKAGVIKGDTGWIPKPWSVSQKYEVSAIIEEWEKNKVKERITFILQKAEGLLTQRSIIIEDPVALQKIYDDIQKEIFVRQNLNK